MTRYGLNKHQARRLIEESLHKNPDLKYYINNDYFEEMIELLIDGICVAIEENNNKVIRDIEHQLKIRLK